MNRVSNFIFFLFFLAACTRVTTNEPINYRVGYDGLDVVMSGLPDYPIRKDDIFSVQVDLQNKGAYDIRDGFVSLAPEPRTYFERIDDDEGGLDFDFATGEDPLEGRSQFH